MKYIYMIKDGYSVKMIRKSKERIYKSFGFIECDKDGNSIKEPIKKGTKKVAKKVAE